MSVIDGILTVAILPLFLVILAVMREVVILRGEVTALSQLIVDPPVPSYLGQKLPRALARRLEEMAGGLAPSRRVHAVLFLKNACEGCNDLVADVRRAVGDGILDREDISFVVAAGEEAPIARAAQSISRSVVLDPGGKLLDESEIRATPTVLTVRGDTLDVLDYKLGGELGWIIDQLKRPQANGASPRPVPMASHAEVS